MARAVPRVGGRVALGVPRVPTDERPGAAGLRVPAAIWAAVLEHLLAAVPLEAVGLLATVPVLGGDGAEEAVRFYTGANVDSSPTRYTMAPRDVLVALGDIDAHGWRLGAIVHSHPVTPPVPSATDLREARYSDALMVIVSLATSPPTPRAWRLLPAGPASPVAATDPGLPTALWEVAEVPVVLVPGEADVGPAEGPDLGADRA